MEKDFKEVDVLDIIRRISNNTGQEFVNVEHIVKDAPHPYQTYSFKLLYMLEQLGVIATDPEDRYSYKIIGSILKWEPRYPEDWDYDIERISKWLHS